MPLRCRRVQRTPVAIGGQLHRRLTLIQQSSNEPQLAQGCGPDQRWFVIQPRVSTEDPVDRLP
jgi:hypothetical protein